MPVVGFTTVSVPYGLHDSWPIGDVQREQLLPNSSVDVLGRSRFHHTSTDQEVILDISRTPVEFMFKLHRDQSSMTECKPCDNEFPGTPPACSPGSSRTLPTRRFYLSSHLTEVREKRQTTIRQHRGNNVHRA
jgi:hypothetical protein